MSDAAIKGYAQFAKRIAESEQRDPKLKELKERLRAASACVSNAGDDEKPAAMSAENEAIIALVQYLQG